MKSFHLRIALPAALFLLAIRPCAAVAQGDPCPHGHVDIEQLNQLGADTDFPPYADSVTRADNPLRQAMLCHNMTYRVFLIDGLTVDTIHKPVSAADQNYVGQRPYFSSGNMANLTAVVAGVQVTVAGFFSRSTWQRASPDAFKLAEVLMYKPFFQRRLEFKLGHQNDDAEFVGLQVGGSMASGAQGVYAVLPFEVGYAFMPLAAPFASVRVQPVGGFYGKVGFQRSVSPDGAAADLARNSAGTRLFPKGEKLLTIGEGGYRRDSAAGTPEFWVRGGIFHNQTPYQNFKTGTRTAGNQCLYLLGDRQLTTPGKQNPRAGWFAGASAIADSPEMNAYDRYYEARLYRNGTFRRRPLDGVTVVSSYSGYSHYLTDSLRAAGKSAATHQGTLSASYNFHAGPGAYFSAMVSYISRPAITPNLPAALTLTVQSALFF